MSLGWLQELDIYIFYLLNSVLTNNFFDVFFPFLTDIHKFEWARYGLFPALLCLLIYKTGRRALKILLCTVITIGVCDAVAYRVFKKSIQRLRPHHRVEINAKVRVPHKPKDPSLPSNHATNSAGMATILLWFFPHLRFILIPLVFLVGWSRVYVGVHFPSDVMAGWVLGVAIAYLLKRMVFRRWGPPTRNFLN